MKNIIVVTILGISFLGAVLGATYMYTDYLTNKLETVSNLEQTRISNLRNCFNTQEDKYFMDWNNVCKGRGENDNCSLPADQTLLVEGRLERNQSNCVNIYNYTTRLGF